MKEVDGLAELDLKVLWIVPSVKHYDGLEIQVHSSGKEDISSALDGGSRTFEEGLAAVERGINTWNNMASYTPTVKSRCRF